MGQRPDCRDSMEVAWCYTWDLCDLKPCYMCHMDIKGHKNVYDLLVAAGHMKSVGSIYLTLTLTSSICLDYSGIQWTIP